VPDPVTYPVGSPVTRDYCWRVARASGGIGRRAGFRFLCPKGCGGSSPPSPTRPDQPMTNGSTHRIPSDWVNSGRQVTIGDDGLDPAGAE
jgi:hypothetical protein